jgi:diguanylate cyclase (GGDEF)-like protein
MNDLTINFLVLENNKEIINRINGFINQFNININVIFKSDYEEALQIIKSKNIDYLFIADDIINATQLSNTTDELKKSANRDCIIVFHNSCKESFGKLSNGNFIVPDELSFGLFKKLIGYSIVSKGENVVNNEEFSDIYNNNFISTHDALTMLPNRKFLLDRINYTIKTANIQESSFALFFLDLDGFKDINDTAGHDTGDLVLKEVAKRLIRNTRASDVVSRHGGDEFIVLLPHIKSKNDVEIVADKLLSVLAMPFEIGEENWTISSSIGVAIYPEDGLTAENLISNADAAMYMAKQSGKSTVRYFNKDLAEQISQKINIQEEVRKAILHDDFEILLQPQHDLVTNKVIGAEAFIRWHHKQQGLIMPEDFLPYIANTGYINSLGNFILQKCLGLIYQINSKDVKIAINVEPRQLVSDSLINKIVGMKKMGVQTEQLAIEITEDCFKINFKIIKQRLETLKSMGIMICLDDFGLGTSSITHLAELPIDIIKIDNKILCDKSNNKVMKSGIISLARSFGIKTMAKRIDNNEQLRMLRELGCDYGQGYCYSKPIPISEFKDYIINLVPKGNYQK